MLKFLSDTFAPKMWCLVLILATIFCFVLQEVDTLTESTITLTLPSVPTPEFSSGIENVTAAVGREAILTCRVTDLGAYKVGWMKADDQTVLSLHTRVITHNPRITVTYGDNFSTWQLRIRQLKESDRGCYMCQINTSSMRKQLGCIDVQVSPDIDDTETSPDFTVAEGENVTLVCKASGHPKPRIIWRREDGDKLVINTGTHQMEKDTFSGSQLVLLQVERHQMGAYLCIASNDVPPTVSKRIMLNINFIPNIHVPRGLIGLPIASDAKLKCEVESFPFSANQWIKNEEEVIKNAYRYKIQEKRSGYKTIMILTISNISYYDYGTYKCVASNSLGKAGDSIRLYEVKISTTTSTTTTTLKTEIISEPVSPSYTTSASYYMPNGTFGLDQPLKEDLSDEWLFPPSVVPAPLEFETYSRATHFPVGSFIMLLFVILNLR